jgi:hypothetical protein
MTKILLNNNCGTVRFVPFVCMTKDGVVRINNYAFILCIIYCSRCIQRYYYDKYNECSVHKYAHPYRYFLLWNRKKRASSPNEETSYVSASFFVYRSSLFRSMKPSFYFFPSLLDKLNFYFVYFFVFPFSVNYIHFFIETNKIWLL